MQSQSNSIYVKPIVFGTCAFWLGKKADESVSHKWCIYVRGNHSEDLSLIIKEVSFTLHSSFTNHIRFVKSPPYELYESGWGEFDIKITIYLHDPSLRPIEHVHGLKLYPFNQNQTQSTKKPIISETYDEIIIVNPKMEYFPKIVNEVYTKKEVTHENHEVEDEVNEITDIVINEEENIGEKKSNSFFNGVENYFQPISDEVQYKTLQEVNQFVTLEIEKMKTLLENNEKDINNLKRMIKENGIKIKG